MTNRTGPLRSADHDQAAGGGTDPATDAAGAASGGIQGQTPETGISKEDAEAIEAAASSLADLADAVSATVSSGSEGSSGAVIAGREARPVVGTPRPFEMDTFDTAAGAAATRAIDLLSDVNLNVKIELGRTRMLVSDVLKLGEGSVVELDKLAGDPVDIYVNDRPIARGEVLVLNENFCVRINEIIAQIPDGATPSA